MRGQFQRLAPKPHFLRGAEYRAMPQTLDQLLKRGAKPLRRGHQRSARLSFDHVAHEWVQIVGLLAKMLFQERRRKLHRDKPMSFSGPARRDQRRVALVIECKRLGWQLHGLLALFDRRGAVEVKAQLDAAGMKAPRPIQFLHRGEIVPLETETKLA